MLTIELISPVLEDLSLLSQGIEELAVMGGSIGTHLAENCCVRHTRKYDLQYHFQSDRVLELCLQCHHMGMLLLYPYHTYSIYRSNGWGIGGRYEFL